MAEEPSAVLLIRVWLEGEEKAFRARLSGISGSEATDTQERTVAVAATSRDVVVAVQRWLEEFLRARDPGIES